MQQLMDPSRNMSRYRNLLNGDDVQPPVIPFYPVVKKDLTFIHIANDSKLDGLVNFEKLRMIAKEVKTCLKHFNMTYNMRLYRLKSRHSECNTYNQCRLLYYILKKRKNLEGLKVVKYQLSLSLRVYFVISFQIFYCNFFILYCL